VRGTRQAWKRWRKRLDVVDRLVASRARDVVLGGGNSRMLTHLPPGCRLGIMRMLSGGFLMWEDGPSRIASGPIGRSVATTLHARLKPKRS
jgi:hypothetical protein